MARRKVNRPTKKKLLTIDDLYSFYLEQKRIASMPLVLLFDRTGTY